MEREESSAPARASLAGSARPLTVELRREARRLERAARQRVAGRLLEIGLSAAQYEFLSELRVSPAASGASLAERVDMAPQTVWPMLNRLQKLGWVARRQGSDLRSSVVELTPSGEAIVERAEEVLRDFDTHLAMTLPAGEWPLLLGLVATAVDALQQ